MQIDEFQRLDQHGASVGLAFDPKQGGTHYCFVVANADGEITRLDRHVGNGCWERVKEEPPFSLRVLVRHRLAGFA